MEELRGRSDDTVSRVCSPQERREDKPRLQVMTEVGDGFLSGCLTCEPTGGEADLRQWVSLGAEVPDVLEDLDAGTGWGPGIQVSTAWVEPCSVCM